MPRHEKKNFGSKKKHGALLFKLILQCISTCSIVKIRGKTTCARVLRKTQRPICCASADSKSSSKAASCSRRRSSCDKWRSCDGNDLVPMVYPFQQWQPLQYPHRCHPQTQIKTTMVCPAARPEPCLSEVKEACPDKTIRAKLSKSGAWQNLATSGQIRWLVALTHQKKTRLGQYGQSSKTGIEEIKISRSHIESTSHDVPNSLA